MIGERRGVAREGEVGVLLMISISLWRSTAFVLRRDSVFSTVLLANPTVVNTSYPYEPLSYIAIEAALSCSTPPKHETHIPTHSRHLMQMPSQDLELSPTSNEM